MILTTFCEKCRLYKTAKNPCIRGRGNLHSKLLIVGEAPGRNEDEQGTPFIGAAGKILNEALDQMNIDYFITNAVKCRPIDEKGGNRTPTQLEIQSCKPFTYEIIQEMQPKVILALGNVALRQLLPLKLQQNLARGRVYYASYLNAYVIATYHPAFLLRHSDSMYYEEFYSDLALVQDILGKPLCRYIPSQPKTLSHTYEIQKYLEQVKKSNVVAIDLETTGLDFLIDKITDISLCIKEGEGVHIEWTNMLPHLNLFSQILADEKITKIFHNGKFDIKFLRGCGFDVKGFRFDTMLAYHLLTMQFEGADTSLYKLDTMSYIFTKEGGYKDILEHGIGEFQKKYTKQTREKTEETKHETNLSNEIQQTNESAVQGSSTPQQETYIKQDYVIDCTDHDSAYIEEVIESIMVKFSDINTLDLEREESRKKLLNIGQTPKRVLIRDTKESNPIISKKENQVDLQYSEKLLQISNMPYEMFKSKVDSLGLTPLQYYSAMDADVTYRCYQKLNQMIKQEQKEDVYYNLIIPYTYALMRLEENGIMVDLEYIENCIKENNTRIKEIVKEFKKHTRKDINIDSSTQLRDLLYKTLKLPVVKKTPSGAPSTDEEALHLLSEKSQLPLVNLILEYRLLRKQTTTYLEGFKKLIHPLTQRIHPQYLQHTTATGRLSCANPNLQNVPRDNKIRNMIVARPGYKLIAADLSQVELRILAMVSGDKKMQAAFKSDVDFHTLTACNMFGIPVEKFNKSDTKHQELRTTAKCVAQGTRIPVESGFLRIEDICTTPGQPEQFVDIQNVNVIHPDGRFVKAAQFYNGGLVDCIIVTLENGLTLTGSRTHKIYVIDASTKQLIDKELQELTVEDKVVLQGCVPNYSNNVVISMEINRNSRVIPPMFSTAFSTIGIAESCILGFIFTRGVLVNKNLQVIFEAKDKTIYELFLKYLNSARLKGFLSYYKKSHGYVVSFAYDKTFYTLLEVLEVLQESKIPEFVFRIDKQSCAAFLEIVMYSLWNSEARCLIHIEPQLLKDIQLLLLLNFGIASSFETKSTNSFVLKFQIDDIEQVIEEMHVISTERKKMSDIKCNKGIQYYKVNQYLDYMIMKVESLQETKQQVYDLFVPEGNHYNTAGFISHNSINFGVVYQMSANSLATSLNIDLDRATEFINRFYQSYPDVKRWIDDIMRFCQKHGYVETVHGRRRYLPSVFSNDTATKMRALRQAVNTPIQGTASDCTGFGLIKNQAYLDKSGHDALQVGIVHDCILVECKEDEVEEVAQKLVEHMTTDLPKITIDLKADISISDRWEK